MQPLARQETTKKKNRKDSIKLKKTLAGQTQCYTRNPIIIIIITITWYDANKNTNIAATDRFSWLEFAAFDGFFREIRAAVARKTLTKVETTTAPPASLETYYAKL